MLPNKKIARNIIFMVAMAAILSAYNPSEISAQDEYLEGEGIYAIDGELDGEMYTASAFSGNCWDAHIDYRASCTVTTGCWWPPNIIFLSLYMNPARCPYSSIVNEVRGTTTPSGLAGRGSSTLLNTGLPYGFLWATKDCAWFSGSKTVSYYPENCRPYTPPPPPPNIAGCYECFPTIGEGCNYCESNFMWDAQCSGPSDTVCPLVF